MRLPCPERFDSGDKGGNSIPTRQRSNLHALWDGFLGSDDAPREITNEVHTLLGQPGFKEIGLAAANSPGADQWIDESTALADEYGYDRVIRLEVGSKEEDPELALSQIDLTEEYLTNGGRCTQRRVVEAGYRLAAVLTDALQ